MPRHHSSFHSNTRTLGSSFKEQQTDKMFVGIRRVHTLCLLTLWAIYPLVSVKNVKSLFDFVFNRGLL